MNFLGNTGFLLGDKSSDEPFRFAGNEPGASDDCVDDDQNEDGNEDGNDDVNWDNDGGESEREGMDFFQEYLELNSSNNQTNEASHTDTYGEALANTGKNEG